jgi:hypothetical protein
VAAAVFVLLATFAVGIVKNVLGEAATGQRIGGSQRDRCAGGRVLFATYAVGRLCRGGAATEERTGGSQWDRCAGARVLATQLLCVCCSLLCVNLRAACAVGYMHIVWMRAASAAVVSFSSAAERAGLVKSLLPEVQSLGTTLSVLGQPLGKALEAVNGTTCRWACVGDAAAVCLLRFAA